MRIINELSIEGCKVTFYSWNNRYIIKVEQGFLEQTFKINQFDIADESALSHIIDKTFMEGALKRFTEMDQSLAKAVERHT
jgi:hypothetical protein